MNTWRARGKLLLTGEYAVLDGALALAWPTQRGQTLRFEPGTDLLQWRSADADGNLWFEAVFQPEDWQILRASDAAVAHRLQQILTFATTANPAFQPAGQVHTQLEFPRQWGLGSSSTLIANMAAWANVDAYELLAATLGGSGYDLACAHASGPILYQRRDGRPWAAPAGFHPPFLAQLWVAWLGRKQDSREGIRRYKARASQVTPMWIAQITQITQACLGASSLPAFEDLLHHHEQLISALLDLPTVQAQRFADYWGVVKSLGAWGGDFVLLTHSGEEARLRQYLRGKGIEVVFRLEEI